MRKLKRSLAVLLAVLVLITALPLTAFADEAAESPPMDTAASIDETVPDEPPSSKVSVSIRRGLRNMRRCYDDLFQTE